MRNILVLFTALALLACESNTSQKQLRAPSIMSINSLPVTKGYFKIEVDSFSKAVDTVQLSRFKYYADGSLAYNEVVQFGSGFKPTIKSYFNKFGNLVFKQVTDKKGKPIQIFETFFNDKNELGRSTMTSYENGKVITIDQLYKRSYYKDATLKQLVIESSTGEGQSAFIQDMNAFGKPSYDIMILDGDTLSSTLYVYVDTVLSHTTRVMTGNGSEVFTAYTVNGKIMTEVMRTKEKGSYIIQSIRSFKHNADGDVVDEKHTVYGKNWMYKHFIYTYEVVK